VNAPQPPGPFGKVPIREIVRLSPLETVTFETPGVPVMLKSPTKFRDVEQQPVLTMYSVLVELRD